MKVKKMIAPLIITCLLVIYFLFFVLGIISIPDPLWVKIIMLLVPLFLIGVSIFVLVERINEIRSGEEDDLSKY
ncbi:MAG: hypothetical protein KZY61_03255 [Clostridiaceae bacterium]|nr:hypothetical protein [Clostridiaceae bacterium]MBW4861053.1 hypothetical protein [Clostridiaceae bacterium]MBW4867678.1 hypothetical protein [Clostridiaceae bacterium]